jgi:hypothetical protein
MKNVLSCIHLFSLQHDRTTHADHEYHICFQNRLDKKSDLEDFFKVQKSVFDLKNHY